MDFTKKIIFLLLAQMCLFAQTQSSFTTVQRAPYVSLIQSAGSDCIFALHTDTITGMSCANTMTDGTTETAFTNGVSIPANTLSSSTTQVNSTFLVHTSGGTTPTIKLGLRLGGIGGTLIYQTLGIAPTSAVSNAVITLSCNILALGTSSASTALVVSCASINLGQSFLSYNSLLSNTTQSIAADTTTTKTLVWTVTYSLNTANNAVGLYSMFNGIK